jgi:hypothetical protein
MFGRVTVKALAAGALLAGFGVGTAAAMDLVAGGYGEDVERYAPPASLSMRSLDFSTTATTGTAGLTFDFTPRATGSLFTPSTAESQSPVSLSLGIQERYGDQLRLDTMGLGGSAGSTLKGLAIGGAFSVHEWHVSGSMGRANLLGDQADVFSAGVGYGPLNARLTYGTVPEATGTGRDVLMFSTDLAAWSWLTLQGDVAVSDTLAEEPLTVGRIGLRLNF